MLNMRDRFGVALRHLLDFQMKHFQWNCAKSYNRQVSELSERLCIKLKQHLKFETTEHKYSE